MDRCAALFTACILVCLPACAGDLPDDGFPDERDVTQDESPSPGVDNSVGVVPQAVPAPVLEFPLPQECERWSVVASEPAEHEIVFTVRAGAVDDLEANRLPEGGRACLQGMLRAISTKPYGDADYVVRLGRGPLTPEERAAAAARPRFESDKKPDIQMLKSFMSGIKKEVAHCSPDPIEVRVKMSIDGPNGTIQSVSVREDDIDPDVKNCIVEVIAGREIGAWSDRRRGVIYPLRTTGDAD